MLDRDAHQLRQRAYAKLGLQLGADVGDGLVAHMQMLGDYAVGLAFGDDGTVMRFSGLVVPLASMKAISEARSWLR